MYYLFQVLCLHGNNQNKDIFRQKTGSFRKPLKKFVDFEYLDAPHLLEQGSLQEDSLGPVNPETDSIDICSGNETCLRFRAYHESRA